MRKIIAALSLVTVGILSGCGGSGNGSTAQTKPVSGVVADGYLQNALVFLDKNGNYQLDPGEPNTTTDQNGGYILNVDPADVGKYPIVAMAIKGQTTDKDNNQTVPNTYMLSIPPTAVSGTVSSNFISPMSTLIREKMEANPGMTLVDAMTQLRNQLNMPSGMNISGDYVAGANAGQYQVQYQAMHKIAQQMAGLMADQSGLVMNGNNVSLGRYRSMMGQLNQNLPQIAGNVTQGQGMNSTYMISLRSRMQTMLAGMSTTSGFRNLSTLFRNMTSHQSFWTYSGRQVQPRGGMMGMK